MHKQNMLFQYFTDTFDHLIEKDKKEGKYDMGILGGRRERGKLLSARSPLVSCPQLTIPRCHTLQTQSLQWPVAFCARCWV